MQKNLRSNKRFGQASRVITLAESLRNRGLYCSSGWQKPLLLLLLCLLPLFNLQAQSTANYTFSTATNGSLTDMSSGTTQLIGPNSDNSNSVSVSNIGFEFYLMGRPYTQFAASSNGLVNLSNTSTLVTTTTYTVGAGTNTTPLISAFASDLSTGSNGKVHYKVAGTVPNRVLVVEFLNMSLLWKSGTPYPNNGTYQVRLYEGSNSIEFVYGTMVHNGSAANTGNVQIGFAYANTATNCLNITSAANTAATNAAFTNQTYSAGAIANLNSSSDGSRRVYTMTPATIPLAPSDLTFSAITLSGMTLNWTDNSSNEIGFAILRSTDNVNFTYVTTTAANAITYAATGLTAGTTYYWKVAAVKEGGNPSAVEQATTTGGATYTWKNTVSTGAWGTATNWSPDRTTPLATDVLQFSSDATVTSIATATIGQLILSSNVTVVLQSGATATLTIGGGGADDLIIPTGSTLNLNSANSLTLAFTTGNIGTIRGTLTLGGTTNTFTATNASVTVDGTINNGGVVTGTATNLILSSGATYNHTRNGGTVPALGYDANATVNITGITTTAPSMTSSVGNLNWNSTGQTASALSLSSTLTTVNGNFTVTSTGSGSFALGTGPATTVKGNFIQTGGTMLLSTSSGTFTVNGNFTQSGSSIFNMNSSTGTTTLALQGNLIQSNTAVISRTGASGASVINFNGTANQAVTFNAGGVTNTVSYTITNNAGISLTGTMPVNDNATLTIASTATDPIAGGTVTYGTTNTTLAYTAAGPLTATSNVFPSSNGPVKLTVNVSGTFPNNQLNLLFSCSLTGTLTMTAGNIDLGGNTLTLGASAAAPGTLAYTAGSILSGTFSRYLGTAAIASGAVAGRFPLGYVSAGTLYDRTLYLDHTGILASGGLVNVTYRDNSGKTPVATFPDNGLNIDLHLNSNWVVSHSGLDLGGNTMNMSVQGTGIAAIDDYTKLILMQDLSAAGTAGTNTGSNAAPKVFRSFTSDADLNNTFYIGSESNYNPFEAIITAVASGNWGDAATWDNGVPTAANNVIIPTGITVTLNTTSGSGPFDYACANLNLNGTGALLANANTLTIGQIRGDKKIFTVNGTLTLSDATINLNGNLIMNTGATFNMSAGALNIDGNDGLAQTSSVASGTNLFDISGNITSNVTGGTITFVDPPFAGAGLTLRYNGTTNMNWAGNTIHFGDGSSTDPSTATNGFNVNTFLSTGRLVLGHVIVNGGSAARIVTAPSTTTDAFNIGGNLTITANSELRTLVASPVTVGGDITNNGTLTTTTALELNSNNAATTLAQTISGSGVFRNSATASTGSFSGLVVNNTNAAGVTIDVQGLTIPGVLTLTSGLVKLGSNHLTLGSAATISGTPSATNMIVLNGTGQLKKTFATGNTAAFTFPIGEISGTPEYSPVMLDFSTNDVARTIGVNVTNTAHPSLTVGGTQPQTDYLNRYWNFSDDQAGTYTYTSTFRYTSDDIAVGGTEANIKANRWDGTKWNQAVSNAALNILTISTALTQTTGTLGGNAFTGRVNPPETYTWNGSVSNDYTDATNWTPNRNALEVTDILVFDNGLTNTVTDVPAAETIGKLLLSNNTTVELQSAATAALTIGGGSGDDLVIPAGSTLNLNSANAFTLAFSAGNTGTIDGTLVVGNSNTFNATNATGTGKCTVSATGIINNSGSGSVVTATTNLVLSSGATYTHTRNGGTIPALAYDANSTVNVTGITTTAPAIAASVGNLTWNSTGQTIANASISTLTTVNGNFTITSTGSGSIVLPANVTVFGDLKQDSLTTIYLNSTGTLTLKKSFIQEKGKKAQNAKIINSGANTPVIAFDGGASVQIVKFEGRVLGKVGYTILGAGGISLTDTMQVNTGAKLTVTSTGPISGLIIYSGTTTLAYNGTAAQTATITEFPTTNGPTNVNISNTVTLTGGPRSILGTLDLATATGILKLDACNLTFGPASPTPTSYNGTTSYILQDGTGRLFKTIPQGGAAAFSFPVATWNSGTNTAEYSGIGFTFATNTLERTIGVGVTTGTPPNNGGSTNYVKRYWTFTDNVPNNVGSYTYNMSCRTIKATDVVGFVSKMKINRYDGTSWHQVAGYVDSVNNVNLPLLKVTPDQTLTSSPLGGNIFTARLNPTTEFTWVGGTSTDWFTSSNWSPNGIPTGSDSVVIKNAAATYQPVLSNSQGPVSLKSLTLLDGSLTLGTDASLVVESTVTYAAPASANFDCSSTFTYANSRAQTIYALEYGNLVSSGAAARIFADGNVNICKTFTTGTSTYTSAGPNSSVNFTGIGAINIPGINYNSLSISGARGTNNITLANGTGTITVGGSFTSTASFTTGTFVPGTGTVVMNSPDPHSIPAITYYNLTTSGGNRTIADTVKIGNTFTPGTGTYTVTGSTVEFNGTSTQTIPALTVASGGNYNNLVVSGSGTYSLGGSMTLDGNFTQTAGLVNVVNAAANYTVNISGDLNISGGTFRMITLSSATGATVNVGTGATPKNLNISGNGSINLESTSSANGKALLVVHGNVVTNTSATNALDFGSGTVTFNEVQIGGDLTISGTGKFFTTTTTTTPVGVTFNKAGGVQTVTSSVAHQKTLFTVNSGSTVVLGSDFTMSGTAATPAAKFTVIGKLDMADKKLTGGGTNNTFIVNAGGVVKTSYATGLNDAVSSFATRTFDTGADLELSGTAAITQNTIPTEVRNLIISNTGGVTLGSNMIVNEKLELTGGILQTGTNKVILKGSDPVVETPTAYVKGILETDNDMNTPGTYTFNGIGITLSPQASSVNFPGSTTVRRVTGTPVVGPNNSQSIARVYEIVPTMNQDLNITMVFNYEDHELNGIDEANLVFFKSATGSAPWIAKGYSSRNAADNKVTLDGISGFSTWTLGDNSAPLPVEMVAFGAKKVGSNVEITWTTATEKNSQGYEVQVSANGTEFRKLGFVESHNGNNLQEYRFTDRENGKTGIRYYRLKQIDLDGTVTYYGPKTVRFDTEKLQLNVYPNPFDHDVNLDISAVETGKVTLILSDLTGKIILDKVVNVQKGKNSLLVGVDDHWPAGVYLLKAQFGTDQITTRLFKK